MTIKYSGRIDNGTRCAIISYNADKEQFMADQVISALTEAGYRTACEGDDTTNEIYVSVYDRDDFEELKDIYMAEKRCCKI